MHKLKFPLAIVFIICSVLAVKIAGPAAAKEMKHRIPQGKARSPIFTRIIEKSVDGGIATLEGRIETRLANVNIKWELPEGSTLVEGVQEEVATPNANGVIHRTVKVRVNGQLTKPHLSLLAFIPSGGERLGHSAVYRLVEDPAAIDPEKLDLIKQHLKAHEKKLIK